MSYGIELNNNDGKTVIGYTHKNLAFHQKITGTAGTYATSSVVESTVVNTFNTTITDSSKKPVVYFVPDQDYSTIYKKDHKGYMPVRIYYAAGVWKIDVASDGEHSSSIILYVFIERSESADSWGLRTYNADGSPAFDSGLLPVVLVGLVSLVRAADSHFADSSQSSYTLGAGSVTLPAAAQISSMAISITPFFYGSDSVFATGESSAGNSYFLGGIKRISATQLGTFWGYMGDYGSAVGFSISGPLWSSAEISIIDGAVYD